MGTQIFDVIRLCPTDVVLCIFVRRDIQLLGLDTRLNEIVVEGLYYKGIQYRVIDGREGFQARHPSGRKCSNQIHSAYHFIESLQGQRNIPNMLSEPFETLVEVG